MALIQIDGLDLEEYCIVDGLEETFTLIEGSASQRKQNFAMFYDIVGTEFKHTVLFRKNPEISIEKWNELWAILSQPVDFHTIAIYAGPYFMGPANGKNETQDYMTYLGHISTGTRKLEYIDSAGNKHWGDYSIEITPNIVYYRNRGRALSIT